MSIIFMDKDEEVLSFWPYRQFYAGINGYLLDDRLYFSIGYDLFDHIKQWGGDEFGMIRTNYSFDGYESIDSIISNYWQTESQSWDLDSYWEQFNIYYNYKVSKLLKIIYLILGSLVNSKGSLLIINLLISRSTSMNAIYRTFHQSQ